MNNTIDDLITRMDAVMCGQLPGEPAMPEFDDATMGQLRAILTPAVADCRVCERYAPLAQVCVIPSHCVGGDKFVRVQFVPLWRTDL